MATISVGSGKGKLNSGVLSAAQTGNGASTNVANLGRNRKGSHHRLTLVTTVGATPTVDIVVEGSVDGTTFVAAPYMTVAAPQTPVTTTLQITSATTTVVYIHQDWPWKFIRLTYSLNTNVTTTATLATL